MKIYEYLEDRSMWTQGVSSHGNAVCLVRAFNDCYSYLLGTGHYFRNYQKLSAAIETLYPNRGLSVIGFNDHPETTHDDIIRVTKFADV